jgi:O-antigen ligase
MNKVAYGALWLFVFFLPWERMVQLASGTYIMTKATGAIALGLFLLTAVISARIRRWHPYHAAALLFIVWSGALVLTHPREIPGKYWTFVQLFLMIWMIWELAPSRGRLLALFSAYVLGAYVAALDTILMYLRQGGLLRRFAAGGADPNDLAMILALGLPMAWYLGMSYRRPFVQWACRGYLIVAVIALGLTGSRGGMVAAMVALLIVPLTLTKLSPGKRMLGMVLLCVALAVAVSYTPSTLVERLASTSSSVSEGTLGGRGRIWAAGLKAFTLRPFLGYGTGMFKAAVAPFGVGQIAHNAFLSVMVEEGLIGLLIFLAMLAMVFLELMNLRGFERRFALVLFATVIVAMLPLSWEDDKAGWFVLAALVGLCNAPVLVPQAIRWRPPQPASLTGASLGGLAQRPAGAPGPHGRLDARG